MTTSSYRVSAVFTLKDTESKDKFVTFCNGENGLSITRAWKGCKSLNMYESRLTRKRLNLLLRICVIKTILLV